MSVKPPKPGRFSCIQSFSCKCWSLCLREMLWYLNSTFEGGNAEALCTSSSSCSRVLFSLTPEYLSHQNLGLNESLRNKAKLAGCLYWKIIERQCRKEQNKLTGHPLFARGRHKKSFGGFNSFHLNIYCNAFKRKMNRRKTTGSNWWTVSEHWELISPMLFKVHQTNVPLSFQWSP